MSIFFNSLINNRNVSIIIKSPILIFRAYKYKISQLVFSQKSSFNQSPLFLSLNIYLKLSITSVEQTFLKNVLYKYVQLQHI